MLSHKLVLPKHKFMSYEPNLVLLDFDTRSCVVCQHKVTDSVCPQLIQVIMIT